jgi:predicted RNase H-like nuclease (RuvC/YqgF family)
MQFKMNEDSFKNSEANILIKEKEMEALEQMIGSLKENKRYLEKTVKEKDDVIANIEAQLYSLKTSKNESEQTQREMNELRSQKVDLQRQISSLIKINQEHETNNYNFAQNEKNWTLNLNSLREDRDRLLKEK